MTRPTLDSAAQCVTERNAAADRWAVRFVMNIKDDRDTWRGCVAEHTVVDEAVCMRNPKTRAIFRKSCSLGQIKVIVHERRDEMIGKILRTRIRCAFGRTIPCLSDLQ